MHNIRVKEDEEIKETQKHQSSDTQGIEQSTEKTDW